MEGADAARARLADALIRTGAGDRAAFREVYALTSAKLFGICLRICQQRQAAEDVMHEVYLTVWQRAGAFEPGRASPITWLATIARNRAIDWCRAQGQRSFVGIDQALPVADPAPLADAALEARQERHRLIDCLGELEPRQREAIGTAFFDGATYAAIAEQRAMPLGTVKSWVRRGLARLRECLQR